MCPAPSNSRHRPRPNNPGSRYNPRPGKEAARRLVTAEDQSERRCPQQIVLGIEPGSSVLQLQATKNKLNERYA
jgi:hypothetical protein